MMCTPPARRLQESGRVKSCESITLASIERERSKNLEERKAHLVNECHTCLNAKVPTDMKECGGAWAQAAASSKRSKAAKSSSDDSPTAHAKMTAGDTEVFLLPNGCLYHLGVKAGELNPRILTVGDRERARMIAKALLDDAKEYEQTRNFLTFSGTFRGTPVSVVSIGMGAPNMDFLVRESSYLFEGKGLAFVRLGTCGIFKPKCPVGTLFISDKIYYSYRNYAQSDGSPFEQDGLKESASPYLIAGPVPGDKELTDRLQAGIEKQQLEHCRGSGISAETFYSCQGRHFPGFGDDNAQVLENFKKLNVDSCEMESHQLFHLCRQRSVKGGVVTRAASICLGVVNRVDPNSSSNRCTASET
ncbi:hypothetical protein Efla_003717 [Eimeria flavescens]